jgi:PAS domain S-box-containing protein
VSACPDSGLFLDFTDTAGVIEAFEDFPMVLMLTDSESRFIRVNRAASVFLGRTEHDLVGRLVRGFLASEFREGLVPDVEPESADAGSYEEHEWAFVRPDQTIVWGAVRTLRLKDQRDRTWLRFNVVEDLTASRLAACGEADLHQDLRAAEQTQRRSQAVIDAAAAALPVTFTTVDRNLIFTSVAGGLEVAGTIVAEGVETEAEAATLRDLGYELGQGYLLARPMPIKALTARLHGGAADASREM